MEEKVESTTIHDRLLHLKHAGWPDIDHERLCDQSLIRLSYDGVLDALDAIYKECAGSTTLSKDKYISRFLKKYKSAMKEFNDLRLKATDFSTKAIIGQGHFGEVRVVEEKTTSDIFAMKVMKKNHILQQADAAFFIEERDIMALGSSQWLTKLHYAFQDDECLYLVMDYHPGGDLFTIMGRKDGGMSEGEACFYLAEIICALQDLHNLGYAHRDVKPDNVLIARSGHIKLVDFGSASRLDENGKVIILQMAFHFKKAVQYFHNSKVDFALPVGTPEYISPEVLTSLDQQSVYSVTCDWWSVGIILYELLFDVTPFEGSSTAETYGNIMNFEASLQFPDDVEITADARNLIQSLLVDSKTRLTYNHIIKHRFFNNIDWKNIKSMVPPFIPVVNGPTDTSNFDSFEPLDDINDSVVSHKSSRVFTGRHLPFVGFSYTWGIHATELPVHESICIPEAKELNDMAGDIKRVLGTCQDELKQANQQKLLAERECLVYKKQLEELHGKLAQERKERGSSESKALQLLAEVREQSKVAQEMRESETKEFNDQVQGAVAQLEQERILAVRKAQRAQEELKKKQIELDSIVGKCSGLKAKLTQVRETGKKDMSHLQNKLNKVNEDFAQRMTQMHKDYAGLQEKYNCAMKELKSLKDHKLEQDLKHKQDPIETITTGDFSQLQSIIKQLDSQKQLNEEYSIKILEYEKELELKTLQYQDLEKSLELEHSLNNDLREKLDRSLQELKCLENAEVVSSSSPSTDIILLQEELQQLTDEYRLKVTDYEKEIALKNIQCNDYIKELELERSLNAKLYDDIRHIRQEHGKLQAAHIKLSKQVKCQESRLEEVSKETEQALLDKATVEEELDFERTKMQIQAAQFTKLIDIHQNTPGLKKKTKKSLKISRKKRDPVKERDEWTKLKDLAKTSKPVKDGTCLSTPSQDKSQSNRATNDVPISIGNSQIGTPATSSLVMSKTGTTPKTGMKRSAEAGILEHNIPHRWVTKSGPFHKSHVCVTCNGAIKNTQKFLKCTYCNFVCHQKCAEVTPNSCGLPKELALQLYTTSPPKRSCCDKENTPTSSTSSLHKIKPLSIDIVRCQSFTSHNTTDLSITSSMLAEESIDNDDSLV